MLSRGHRHLAVGAIAFALACPAVSAAEAAEQTIRTAHVEVRYTAIPEPYAKALAATAEAARAAAEKTGFDMPATIVFSADGAGQQTRLFNDGQDRFFLTVRSARDLAQPRSSGIFHIYGICHEVGHLAMYRPIQKRHWMTTAAAEGWAHFLGSQLTDAVYQAAGADLWPDHYDYRADGMARLKRQLAARDADETTKGAGLWMELHELLGAKGVAALFAAWGQADVPAEKPADALAKVLLAADKEHAKVLAKWWEKAGPLFVQDRPRSSFPLRQLKAAELAGRRQQIAHDDGKPAGRNSFAGGGHAARFDAGGEGRAVVAAAVYGARYGSAGPKDEFHLWLCDAHFLPIAEFALPYAAFAPGSPRWVSLKLTPTEVPREFIVCVGFEPTATHGVFVYRDAQASGKSLVGLPGRAGQEFSQGDWLIRVQLDEIKAGPSPRTPR